MSFHSIERKPDNNRTIISSTKIRALAEEGKDFSAFVPPYVTATAAAAEKYGTVSTYALRTKSADELAEIANISEGMENRIARSEFNNFAEFLRLTTRRYTRSTIKRIAACATAGVTKALSELADAEKPYTTVLAASDKKKNALFSLLASSDGWFFFKPSDCPEGHPVRPLIDLDERAAKIQKLCQGIKTEG